MGAVLGMLLGIGAVLVLMALTDDRTFNEPRPRRRWLTE